MLKKTKRYLIPQKKWDAGSVREKTFPCLLENKGKEGEEVFLDFQDFVTVIKLELVLIRVSPLVSWLDYLKGLTSGLKTSGSP